MGYKLGANPCVKCQESGGDSSGDNFHWYGEEKGGHCWACGFTVHSQEFLEEMKESGGFKSVTISNIDRNKFEEKKLNQEGVDNLLSELNSELTIKYRGLDKNVCSDLGVHWKYDSSGKVSHMYFPATYLEDGEIKVSGYKIRQHPKDFYSKGYVGKVNLLAGQTQAVTDTLVVVGGECFTEDTEVLTESGFVKFSEVNIDSLVLQVDENKRGEFVKPLALIKKHYEGDLVGVKTAYTHTLTTPNHNLVFESDKYGVFKQKASEKISKGWFVPKSVNVNGKGTGLTKKQLQLVIAVCADGSINSRKKSNNVAHFGLMKKRKIERLTGILNDLKISYSSYVNTYSNDKQYTTFNFTLPDYVDDKNLRNDWLVSATIDERLFILDELKHWDGYSVKDRNSIEFSSKSFDDVSFIQELAHTCGYYASVKHKSNDLGEWYKVLISFTGFKATTQKFEKYSKYHNGYVYCVTVPTGMIVIRHEGKVSVCGNCDLISAKQMLAPIEKKYNRQINVVSSLLGEDSTADCLKTQIEWVEKHKKIILALDNDDAGKKATQKCLDFLPKDKLFTANLRYKDANDYIKNKDTESYMQDAYWNVSAVESYGVKGSKELLRGAKLRLQQEKVPFPEFMSDLADHFTDRSMWIGEWVNWISGVSSGKSTVFDAWMIDWALTSPYRQAIMSYESDWKSFGVKVASLATTRAVMKIEGKENRLKFIEENEDEILKLLQTDDGDDRFDFVDQLPKNISEAKKLINYLVKIRGVRILWIDPTLDFLSICQSKNEYDELILFLDNIRMTEDVTIMCALHTRKQLSSGSNASEGGEIQEEDAYGGREVIAKGTLNLTAQRNKNAQDLVEKNTMIIKIRKNRNDQVTGVTTKLYYRPKANKLYPYSYAESKGFFMDDLNKSVEEINLDDSGFNLSVIGAKDIDIIDDVDSEVEDW